MAALVVYKGGRMRDLLFNQLSHDSLYLDILPFIEDLAFIERVDVLLFWNTASRVRRLGRVHQSLLCTITK